MTTPDAGGLPLRPTDALAAGEEPATGGPAAPTPSASRPVGAHA